VSKIRKMTYVMYLFRPVRDVDPFETARQMFPPSIDISRHTMDVVGWSVNATPPTAYLLGPRAFDDEDEGGGEPIQKDINEVEMIQEGVSQRKFELAEALKSRNPELKYQEAIQMAVDVGMSLEQACRPFRVIELSAKATNNVRIEIFEHTVRISIPYAHIGDEVRQIFGEIWEYINILKREAKYFTYDPQMGRLIKNTADMILSMTLYEHKYAEKLKMERQQIKKDDVIQQPENPSNDSTQPLRPERALSPGDVSERPAADGDKPIPHTPSDGATAGSSSPKKKNWKL
jgi:hypothetical protein